MTIEIFITNVTKKKDSIFLKKELEKVIPNSKINFDLEDFDKILRIESLHSLEVTSEAAKSCLCNNGFECKILTD